ncbi:MAG TPA: hypothetical protein VH639_20375 [Bryobacteraceae bacterium]
MSANTAANTVAAKVSELYDQIVIGMGASALTFLHSAFMAKNAMFLKQRTLVIGDSDLWARTATSKPTHAMGQPAALLQPQAQGKGPNTEVNMPHYTGAQKGQYLTTQSFVDRTNDLKSTIQDERQRLKQDIEFLRDAVTLVKSGMGQTLSVQTRGNKKFLARQVVVASGIGAPAIVPELDVSVTNKQLLTSNPRGFPEIIDAVSYYTYSGAMPQGMEVLVYGGSATAAWATTYAALNNANYFWMCRKGIDQISTEGNPVGRNTAIIKKSVDDGSILRGSVKSVEVVDSPGTGTPPEARLKVIMDVDHIESHNRKWVTDRVTGKPALEQDYKTVKNVSMMFHQIVYALGSNPVGTDPLGQKGPGAIIDPTLRTKLKPVYSSDFQFMGENSQCLVAFHTEDEALWVVGAGVFGGAGAEGGKDLGKKYSDIGKVLPHAARPPEGIAILTAAINAVTGYTDLNPNTFDWSRSSPEQIRKLFETLYPEISAQVRGWITNELIRQRTDTKFEFTRAAVKKILENLKDGLRSMYQVHLDIDRLRLG